MDKMVATIVIVGMILFAGFAVSRAEACRSAGNKTVTCAIGFE